MREDESRNNELPDGWTFEDEIRSSRGLFIAGVISGVGIVVLTLAVAFIGFGAQSLVDSLSRKEKDPGITLKEDSAITKDSIKKLQALEEIIDKYFFLGEVTDEELQNGMYKGLLDALGDPYSEYYTAEELNMLMEQSSGIYYGIGAYVSLDTKTGLPKIAGVIENSPAEDAELRADDLVYEVDGTTTMGLSLTETVSMIKGQDGTEVNLTIIREGERDYLHMTLTRRKVESPTVEFSMKEEDMAYIQVTEFDDVTVEQFAAALAMARGNRAKGIILDLRGNPGGNLDSVVKMCDMILPKGLIVYTEDKYGERSEYTCDGERKLELPLVVLVDRNSASAAEIMAGAIKDYGIGTLVGTTTFGKGIVQAVKPFIDGSAIKVTISAYYTPNGNNIHGIGIEPDVVCEFDGEAYYNSEHRIDNQLDKAVEVLREMIRRN